MQVVEVIPISRSRFLAETLSYFTTKELRSGALVNIILRGKAVPAIVKKVSEVKDLKARLKKQAFGLKPLKGVVSEKFFSKVFVRILEKIYEETLVPPSRAAYEIVPKALLAAKTGKITNLASPPPHFYHAKIAVAEDFSERIGYYRALIRENFAKSESVLIVAPRVEEVLALAAELSRGIEEYVFYFSSALKKSEYISRWAEAASLEHSVLVIGTPQLLFFERPDLSTIALDDEGSEFYRGRDWPWLDFRKIAELIAEERKLKLIFAGEILRVETLFRAEKGEIEFKSALTARPPRKAETRFINIRRERGREFSWISPELLNEIKLFLERNKKILVFVNRRGYSSFTVCADCGESVNCPYCSAPLVIHGAQSQNKQFMCHRCLASLALPKKCPACSSWRLRDLGLGIEKVEEILKKAFPKAPLLRFDSDVIPKKNRKNFLKENVPGPGKITLATEAVLSQPWNFDLTAAVSLDHLWSIPDFRMPEKIFRLVAELKNRTSEKFLLQSYLLNETGFWGDALAGNISHFYQEEISKRRKLFYPPFSRLIKLTREDSQQARLKNDAAGAAALLQNFSPFSFPAFLEKIKERYRWNIVIKLEPGSRERWEALRQILQSLRGHWDIIIDPASVI